MSVQEGERGRKGERRCGGERERQEGEDERERREGVRGRERAERERGGRGREWREQRWSNDIRERLYYTLDLYKMYTYRSTTCANTTCPLPPAPANCVPSAVHAIFITVPQTGFSRL